MTINKVCFNYILLSKHSLLALSKHIKKETLKSLFFCIIIILLEFY